MTRYCSKCHKVIPKGEQFHSACYPEYKQTGGFWQSNNAETFTGVAIFLIPIVGLISSIVYINRIDTLVGFFSLLIYLFFSVLWFVNFGKPKNLLLLGISLAYLLLICVLLIHLGVGVYIFLPMFIIHAVNSAYLFLLTMIAISNPGLINGSHLRLRIFPIAASVLVVIGLPVLVINRYTTVTQSAGHELSDYIYSPNAFDRYAIIIHLTETNDIDELHHLLYDPNSDVSNSAYNAIWKLHNDESIPVLIDFLYSKTDQSQAQQIALQFVNSGNSLLESAAVQWALKYGYTIETVPAYKKPKQWSQ